MRLDRFLCKSTELSKAEALARIQARSVCVNGCVTVDASTQVHQNNSVTLDGLPLVPRDFRYLLMHKPAGTVCSNVDEFYPSLFNYLDIERASELHIVGRLDADTTGLVLLTDDGHWSFNITVPSKKCSKVYRVVLSRALSAESAVRIEQGIELQGEKRLTLPALIERVAEKEVLLTLTEGRFHQVKRMFAAVGNRVVSLHREKIGDIALDVDVGLWRHLTAGEMQSFYPQN